MGAAATAMAALALEPWRLEIGGGLIEVRFAPGDFRAGPEAVRQWITNAAQAVTVYFGRFPVAKAVIEVQVVAGRAGVLNGVTYGDVPALTKIRAGEDTTAAQFDADWTMTHELTHMAIPNVPREHHWFEEGTATYVEPIARAQAGTLSVEKVWADMVSGMPEGEPGPNSRGLDRTHTWANTYWGGALFCLLADVRFRDRTGNQRGLQDGLRGVLKAGGNIETEWSLERVFAVADAAVGVPVLMELYGGMKDTPVSIDLPGLWRRLGVVAAGHRVTFTSNAELAAVREAITARRR